MLLLLLWNRLYRYIAVWLFFYAWNNVAFTMDWLTVFTVLCHCQKLYSQASTAYIFLGGNSGRGRGGRVVFARKIKAILLFRWLQLRFGNSPSFRFLGLLLSLSSFISSFPSFSSLLSLSSSWKTTWPPNKDQRKSPKYLPMSVETEWSTSYWQVWWI